MSDLRPSRLFHHRSAFQCVFFHHLDLQEQPVYLLVLPLVHSVVACDPFGVGFYALLHGEFMVRLRGRRGLGRSRAGEGGC